MSNLDYQTENNWYAPLAQTAAAPAETPKKKRLSTGWKAFLGALLVVALIAVSSIAFSSGKESPALPLPTPDQTLPENEEQLPDDWQEFFGSYFLPEEKSGSNEMRLPKVEQVTGYELALEAGAGEELTLQELYQKCAPSIVAISGYVNGKNGYYWGTGIILSKDGLILTNAHVVENCDSAYVTLPDNSSVEALLVGADSTSDIAVLKVDARDLTPAEFGESAALTVGEHVAAIGNPLGETFRMTLTDGIISAIDRGVSYNGHTMTLLQTNCPPIPASRASALPFRPPRFIPWSTLSSATARCGAEPPWASPWAPSRTMWPATMRSPPDSLSPLCRRTRTPRPRASRRATLSPTSTGNPPAPQTIS